MTTVIPQAPHQEQAPQPPRGPRRWPWIVLAMVLAVPAALWLASIVAVIEGEEADTPTPVVDTPANVDEGTEPVDPAAPIDPGTEASGDPAAPADPAMETPQDPTAPADPVVRAYDLTVADMLAEPVGGTVVVNAPWGDGIGAVGLMQNTFGPCCFDVYAADSVVLLDAQNQRLVDFPAGGKAQVIAQFDAAEFNPSALAVIGDVVILAGTTSEPGFPSAVMAMSMATGEVLGQVESAAPMAVDLRATTDGVFWAEPSSSPKWTAVADSAGGLLAPADQVTTDFLPGETTLDWNWDAGISIVAQPAGDSAHTVYNIIEEQAVFGEVLRYQGWSDGVIVLFGGEFDENNRTRVQVFELGTARDQAVSANLYTVEMERWAETGSFGTFRYAFGGLYVLHTTPEGIEIVRYDF